MKLAAETFISIELYVLASTIIPHIKNRCSDKWLNKSELKPILVIKTTVSKTLLVWDKDFHGLSKFFCLLLTRFWGRQFCVNLVSYKFDYKPFWTGKLRIFSTISLFSSRFLPLSSLSMIMKLSFISIPESFAIDC